VIALTSSPTARRWLGAVLLTLLVAALNHGLWALLNPPLAPPDALLPIDGLAYSPFTRAQSPFIGSRPQREQIASDLALLAKVTRRVRTYGAGDGLEPIAELAGSAGLKVSAGAWLDRRLENNELELRTLILSAPLQPSIDQVVVGNEVILRGDLPVDALIGYLKRAQNALEVPVTTADSFATWMAYPELVAHVDFIMVHVLPYWEGDTVARGLERVQNNMQALKARYPDKPIVIGEVGWPSHGSRFEDAQASLANEALFIREFLALAQREGWRYYLMEAFDQPWKRATEGRVGAYWGVFSVERSLKFPLQGPVQADPSWRLKSLLSALLALLPMLFFALAFWRWGVFAVAFFAVVLQLSSTLLVWLLALPLGFYLEWYDWLALGFLLPAQFAILAILLTHAFEFAEVVIANRLQRRFTLLEPAREQPLVSLHLACSQEPPEMVIATLKSLSELDYARFEVLVIDNNTTDPTLWEPVRDTCVALGARFRFFSLGAWPGFKAGALNFALKHTAADAEIIGVIDSDYVVESHWLKQTVGYFDDPKVALVQLPQAHRDFENSPFRSVCNFEAEGFFRIGMHHRHERDAIIMHGTMTLLRRAPVQRGGGWAEWCICEDAELGLRLFREGFSAIYVDQKLGRGLTPADISALKSQRFRWAFGAMQILRKRGAWLFRERRLTLGQRFHFLTGWFSWFADALHSAFSLLAIAWTVGMLWLPQLFDLPLPLYLVPVLVLFLAKAGFGLFSYFKRVDCTLAQALGAAVVSMALSHTVARGVMQGLLSDHPQFNRTAKKRRIRRKPSTWFAVREELSLLLGLLVSVVGVLVGIGSGTLEERLWIAVLLAQAIPALAALALALIADLNVRSENQAS